jgi:hypothetical protein
MASQHSIIMEAYKKMNEKSCSSVEESDDSGGDTSAYNKYLLATKGDLPKDKQEYMHAAESVDDDYDAKYDKWADSVHAAHPDKKLRMYGRIEKGTHTISAEVPGEKRAYGIWDPDRSQGHVFHINESTDEWTRLTK